MKIKCKNLILKTVPFNFMKRKDCSCSSALFPFPYLFVSVESKQLSAILTKFKK